MELLVPFCVGLGFFAISLSIFLQKAKVSLPLESSELFSPHYQLESFHFGHIWCYDNLNNENAKQIPLIFIHSIGSSLYSWRYQIEHFSQNHRVIAFDLLGFGKSDKPAHEDYRLDAQTQRILELLERKKIERCHMIGCSLGGALCLWLKAQHPQLVSKLIAISPAATIELVPLRQLRHELLGPVGKTIISRAVIKLALRGGLAHHRRITQDVVDQYYAPFRSKNAVTAFLKSVSTIKDPRIFQCLKNIREPLLLLWGQKDRVVPQKSMQRILKEMPHARLLVQAEGGHHLMEDEPEWVNLQIENYLTDQS